jgi:predicted NUDIX family NTP pyrophosphohydrolase
MPKRPPYDPASDKPFKLSRSGLELLHDCPRCFYLDKRLGIGRPGGFPFNINSAVDTLLKREFDFHRERAEPHPLMTEFGVDAVPFAHADLSTWRHNFTGVRHLHERTGFLITGAVDDVWVNPAGELIVVDYKATAKKAEITALDQDWHGSYKRQFEIYQWLLRRNGFRVSDRAYWVYANGDASAERFDRTVRFRMTVIPYDGDDSWVDALVIRAKHCLDADVPPTASPGCHWCQFVRDAGELETPRPSGVGPKANPISAGTLLYRGRGGAIEVLLVRALIRGGGAVPWGIPKGAPREGELLIDAARRETAEETGITAPATLVDFGSVTASGHRKTVHCFAGRVGDDVRPVCASHEIDRAEFLTLSEARKRIRHYQKPLLDRLVRLIEPDSAT